MFYVKDRFLQASRILTEGTGSLKARLHDAFIHHVMHVDRTHVPEDCLADFDFIHRHLTLAEPGHEDGVVVAALHRLDDEQTQEIASRILMISMALLYL